MSTITFPDETIAAWATFKKATNSKKGKRCVYAIFALDVKNETCSQVKSVGEGDCGFEDGADSAALHEKYYEAFATDLNENYISQDKPCFAIYFNLKTNKIGLVAVVPDNCKMKERMLYGVSIQKVVSKFEGLSQKHLHVTDEDDLSMKEVDALK
eukprot:g1992.t1